MIDSKSPDFALVFEGDGGPKLSVYRSPDGEIVFTTFWGETRLNPEWAA